MLPLKKSLTIWLGVLLVAAGVIYLHRADDEPVSPRIPQAIGTTEDPHARARYEWMRLRDPATGTVPANVRRKELEFARALPDRGDLSLGKTFIDETVWTSRGPFNLGGRTRALGIDRSNPDVILAGGVSGGMWRSEDGGRSWVETTTPDQHHSVSTLLQDPRPGKENVWYFGSGEPLVGNSPSAPGAPYLGSGVYKSTDGGRSWNRTGLINNDPNFDATYDVIYNLAMDPTNLDDPELYIATYGLLYKTLTDGATRDLVLYDQSQNSSFATWTDVAIDENGVVYAALSSDGGMPGLWRSPDGESWTNITPDGWPTVYDRTVIGIAPSNPNVVYFLADTPGAGMSGHSLWKYTYVPDDDTSAAHGTWVNRSENLPTDAQFPTPQDVGGFSSQGGYDLVIAVKPDDEDAVFIGGTNLYRSTDGFATKDATAWIGGYHPADFIYPNHHPDLHAIVFYPNNPNRMLTGDDGGVHRTGNAMDTFTAQTPVRWLPLNNGYRTTQFYSVAIDRDVKASDLIIGGMQDNGTFFTNNLESKFPWLGDLLGGDGAFADIADADGFVYVSAQQAQIYRLGFDAEAGSLEDAITSFTRVDPPENQFGDALFITPFMLDPADEKRMFLGGGDFVWRNSDLTAIGNSSNSSTLVNWERLENAGGTGQTISAVAPVVAEDAATTRLYYATFSSDSSRVWRIDDAWAQAPVPVNITSTQLPDAYVSCIATNPLDPDEVIVVYSNYNVQSLFHSTDAGATWKNVGGNLELDTGIGTPPSTRWVEILPTDSGTAYFVATSTGLFSTSSLNGVVTWAQEGPDVIGDVVVNMIDARLSDGRVVVGTHGTGVYSATVGSGVSGVAREPGSEAPPSQFRLSAAYPNPFNPTTQVTLSVNRPQQVRIDVYDAAGRRVATLHDGAIVAGRDHRFTFSAEGLSSGTYFIRAAGEEVHATRQVLLVK